MRMERVSWEKNGPSVYAFRLWCCYYCCCLFEIRIFHKTWIFHRIDIIINLSENIFNQIDCIPLEPVAFNCDEGCLEYKFGTKLRYHREMPILNRRNFLTARINIKLIMHVWWNGPRERPTRAFYWEVKWLNTSCVYVCVRVCTKVCGQFYFWKALSSFSWSNILTTVANVPRI